MALNLGTNVLNCVSSCRHLRLSTVRLPLPMNESSVTKSNKNKIRLLIYFA